MNKREYLDSFLNYVSKIYDYNKSKDKTFMITSDAVYSLLVHYNTKEESILPYFNRWIERFKTRPGIEVFKNNPKEYFCRFCNGKVDNLNAIKLYISLNTHNLDSNVTRLFDFVRSNNITHASKVASRLRNDLIVIRVNKKEDAKAIIDFVNQDEEIKKELINPSPVNALYKGVGIARDGNYSYNEEICKVIAQLLNKNIKLNASIFSNYLNQMSNNVKDPELKVIYKIGSSCFKENTLDSICKIEKQNIKSEKPLYDCIDATYKKYGEEQVEIALYKYITENEDKYFTRGNNNLRANLRASLTSNDVLEIITNTIGKNDNLSDLIKMFVNYRYADEISNKKEYQIKDENTYYDSLKTIYLSEGYSSLVKKVNKDYETNRDIIDRIIWMAYPETDAKMIIEYRKNKLIGYVIANLVKGYIDIQEDTNYKR